MFLLFSKYLSVNLKTPEANKNVIISVKFVFKKINTKGNDVTKIADGVINAAGNNKNAKKYKTSPLTFDFSLE